MAEGLERALSSVTVQECRPAQVVVIYSALDPIGNGVSAIAC